VPFCNGAALWHPRILRVGHFTDRKCAQESALADTVRRLGELESVPLGDLYGLRPRARTLAHRWREAFGDDVVDLQREVLLHLPK